MTQVLTVATRVGFAPTKAWRAYTSLDAVKEWNFASPDGHCPSVEMDLQTGGRHCARMEARDGTMGFDFAGTYARVENARCLELVLDDGRKVLTKFEATGDGTTVTTRFDVDAGVPADMQREGWQAILDNYAAYVHARDGA